MTSPYSHPPTWGMPSGLNSLSRSDRLAVAENNLLHLGHKVQETIERQEEYQDETDQRLARIENKQGWLDMGLAACLFLIKPDVLKFLLAALLAAAALSNKSMAELWNWKAGGL